MLKSPSKMPSKAIRYSYDGTNRGYEGPSDPSKKEDWLRILRISDYSHEEFMKVMYEELIENEPLRKKIEDIAHKKLINEISGCLSSNGEISNIENELLLKILKMGHDITSRLSTAARLVEESGLKLTKKDMDEIKNQMIVLDIMEEDDIKEE